MIGWMVGWMVRVLRHFKHANTGNVMPEMFISKEMADDKGTF